MPPCWCFCMYKISWMKKSAFACFKPAFVGDGGLCFFVPHRKSFFSCSVADDKAMMPAYLSLFNFSWSLSVLKRGLWGWWWARFKLITCFSERAVACRFYQLRCQDPRYFNLIGFNEGEDVRCVCLYVCLRLSVCICALLPRYNRICQHDPF